MKKLNKQFANNSSTVEKFSFRVACFCSPKCNCSCQTDSRKRASNHSNAYNRDTEAYSNVFKR
ncbi:hypothetical protein [uncultured Oscillibacter sp.]|uniref:hypothetical protein n=1 Tax=uncultured Oscillibacter sp. TaxID=876091 RepID=UPI0025E5E845|nr:hypothetical protein [uncultured Oscillibacter sp.]